MTDEEKRVDEILKRFGNSVYSGAPDFYYCEGMEFMNDDEAKQALLEMIREARLETSISIVKAEHELLFNKLPVGDVDAWQMLMMLKSHLTMLSERIRADEGALAQLSNNNNTEEGK